MQKRLIEHDLPLADISEASAREKNIRHGHPSTLHIWWARRPLAASRATAFAALIDDPGPDEPEKRAELQQLLKEITPWEAVKSGNNAAIEKARQMIRQQYGYAPKVLDPFAGGGSIPLEALRLGCETYANDYNPVAVFIEKATLEWPQKFGVMVSKRKLMEALYNEFPNSLKEPTSESRSTTYNEFPNSLKEPTSESRSTAYNDFPKSLKPTLESRFTGQTSWLEGDDEQVNLLAFMVERWANIILEEARAEIGRFYPSENSDGLVGRRKITEAEGWIPVGYLWARTIPCQSPTCGAEIPLVKQFWLAKKKGKQIAYRPVVDEANKTVSFELLENEQAIKAAAFDPSDGTVSRGDARCPVCEQIVPAKVTRRLARDGHMGERIVAVILHHPDQVGKKYRLATEADAAVFAEAQTCLTKKIANWPYLESPLPNEELPLMSGTFNVPLYGLDRWDKLFNNRQQLALITFLDLVKKSYDRVQSECLSIEKITEAMITADDLAQVITGYLAIILGRSADFLTTICTWENSKENLKHAFARQALPMAWDYAESNPFSGSTGSSKPQIDFVVRFINANVNVGQPAFIHQNSATNLPFADSYFHAVLTDPPYYNSVPYADLSDFFYVWLKRSVSDRFPNLFITPLTPKTDEICEMAGWDSRRYAHKDKAFFAIPSPNYGGFRLGRGE
jgi:putative DNA methylase